MWRIPRGKRDALISKRNPRNAWMACDENRPSTKEGPIVEKLRWSHALTPGKPVHPTGPGYIEEVHSEPGSGNEIN